MKRSYSKESIENCKSEVIIVPFIQEGRNDAYHALNHHFKNAIEKAASKSNFHGARNELVRAETKGGVRLMAIGLGTAPTTADRRNAFAKAVRVLANLKMSSCSIYLDDLHDKTAVNACVEGITLGQYRFSKYKTQPSAPSLTHVKFAAAQPTHSSQSAVKQIKDACSQADAVAYCRDLINEPANKLGISEFIQHGREIAARDELRCKVVSGKILQKKGFGLISAVGQAATEAPSLLELEYAPNKRKGKRIALIGKGVVFDSGGLCLKPADFMTPMKTDMAGAAVVLSVMNTLTALNVTHNVTAYIPLAENAIGEKAMRPGDVFTSYSGKTVEITNTDAEGRLLLADALSLAQKGRFDEVVDVATLTGACAIALGRKRGAIFTDNLSLQNKWLAAASITGEFLWPLPLAKELEGELKSDVADCKNSGDRFGGAISAALFLKQFTDASKWVHFDIAGPARNTATNMLCPKGGTGYLVLTILQYLQNHL